MLGASVLSLGLEHYLDKPKKCVTHGQCDDRSSQLQTVATI